MRHSQLQTHSAADDGDLAVIDLRDRVHSPSFDRFYAHHARMVEGVVWRVLRDRHQAEELVQEVFLEFWQRPPADLTSPARMLATMARRRAIDRLRSETAHRRRNEATANARVELPDIADDVVVGLEARALASALHGLPFDQRRPIELAFFGHHSYREVATVLGLPEGTVKSRIREGLRRLRSSISV